MLTIGRLNCQFHCVCSWIVERYHLHQWCLVDTVGTFDFPSPRTIVTRHACHYNELFARYANEFHCHDVHNRSTFPYNWCQFIIGTWADSFFVDCYFSWVVNNRRILQAVFVGSVECNCLGTVPECVQNFYRSNTFVNCDRQVVRTWSCPLDWWCSRVVIFHIISQFDCSECSIVCFWLYRDFSNLRSSVWQWIYVHYDFSLSCKTFGISYRHKQCIVFQIRICWNHTQLRLHANFYRNILCCECIFQLFPWRVIVWEYVTQFQICTSIVFNLYIFD